MGKIAFGKNDNGYVVENNNKQHQNHRSKGAYL